MNIKMVGLAVVIAGVSLCVMFFDSYKYMVAALTVVVFGVPYSFNRLFV